MKRTDLDERFGVATVVEDTHGEIAIIMRSNKGEWSWMREDYSTVYTDNEIDEVLVSMHLLRHTEI